MVASRAIAVGSNGAGSDVDLDAAFQLAPIGLAILDRDLRYVRCNDALGQIDGFPPEDHFGRTLDELLPKIARNVGAALRDVFETGVPIRDIQVRGSTPSSEDQDRVWLESVTPLPSTTERIEHILVSIKEITELERARVALRNSEENFRIAQQMSPDGFSILKAVRDTSGGVVDFEWDYANPAACELAGGGELVGRRMLDVAPGHASHPELMARYVRLLAENGADVVEFSYEGGAVDGWYRNSCVAIGHDRIAVNSRDITARKQMEFELRTVGTEFRHRLKNVFAVVAALVRQSARTAVDIDSLAEDVRCRLFAMSSAQGLLVSEEGTGSLAHLVQEILEPFDGPRLVVEPGPDAAIRHDGLVSLALAINELATNAIKFGALSNDTGIVTFSWTIRRGRAVLTWREAGGPAVSQPEKCGLGTRLIEDVSRRLPGGQVLRDFAETDLVASIAFDMLEEGR